MSNMNSNDITKAWVKAASERDVETIMSLLSEDVVVLPPFQDEAATGKEQVLLTFDAFSQVTTDFQYGRDWSGDGTASLEFRAKIDGKPLHGVDIIELDENGKIAKFEILARPLSSVQALRRAVHAHLS